MFVQNKKPKSEMSLLEIELEKPTLGNLTLMEYTEKVILYGLMMLFAASFPLAPLLALLLLLIDIRLDARRMLWKFRRPMAIIAEDIGTLYIILEFLNFADAVSNASLIAFTSSWGSKYSTAEKLWIVIGFEHICFTLKFLLAHLIPDIPASTALVMRKSPPDEHIGTNDYPDFSELPDVTWVNILQYLTLRERIAVSETCHRLNEAFKHPSLWSVYSLELWGGNRKYLRIVGKAFILNEQIHVVKRFGKYFQHLRFIVHGHFKDVKPEVLEIIKEMANVCRLETLTIQVGAVTSEFFTQFDAPKASVIGSIADFVRNAFRMKHLHVRSWPMFEMMTAKECDVFDAITQNKKLAESLETITLFGMDEHEQWSEREPVLLSKSETKTLLTELKNITYVGLRSPMLSDTLLLSLAGTDRARLQVLHVIVHYLAHNMQNFSIPYISSGVWQALRARSPDCTVEFTLPFNVPDMDLANMLAPETPLSVFKVLRYAKLETATLIKLYTHYQKTLVKFLSFCDSYCPDQDLLKLATVCTELREFVYYGQLQACTVESIAKINGEKWKRFEVKADSIKTENAYDDIDEDQVLTRDPNGELVLVGLMRFHQPEEERGTVIDRMTSEVSKILGRPWAPI